MTKVHGKGTYVSLNAVNISAYTSNCEFNRTADSHDVTTFGNDSHVYFGGLGDGTVILTGLYESISVTGSPRLIIEPLIGTVVTLIHRPEGTATGKPQDSVSVLVTSYNEASPVADMVTWTAELQMSSDVATTTQ